MRDSGLDTPQAMAIAIVEEVNKIDGYSIYMEQFAAKELQENNLEDGYHIYDSDNTNTSLGRIVDGGYANMDIEQRRGLLYGAVVRVINEVNNSQN